MLSNLSAITKSTGNTSFTPLSLAFCTSSLTIVAPASSYKDLPIYNVTTPTQTTLPHSNHTPHLHPMQYLHECKRHPTSNDHNVHFVQQIVDQLDLVMNFSTNSNSKHVLVSGLYYIEGNVINTSHTYYTLRTHL